MTKKALKRKRRSRCDVPHKLVERFKLECQRLVQLQKMGPLPRTIWNTQPEAQDDIFGPTIVIIETVETNQGKRLLVAEVSDRIEEATDTDILLLPSDTTVHFSCIIRTSNIFWTTPRWLADAIGEVLASVWPNILKFSHSPESFDHHISPFDYEFPQINTVTVMRREGITSGLPFEDEKDWRRASLRESKEKCRYLSYPLNMGGIQDEEACKVHAPR